MLFTGQDQDDAHDGRPELCPRGIWYNVAKAGVLHVECHEDFWLSCQICRLDFAPVFDRPPCISSEHYIRHLENECGYPSKNLDA